MEERFKKVDRLAWTLVITGIMFLALGQVWVWLEKWLLGEVNNNPVDNIIAIPIIVSLWFNAKSILKKIEELSK